MGKPLTELSPVVSTTMVIRRPVAEVFRAFTDPAVTSRFWFTDSSGPVEPDAELRWTWGMYDLTVVVRVKEFEQDRRFAIEWRNGPRPTTFEMRFTPRPGDATRVDLTETGFGGDDPEEVVTWALNSMGGFTEVLAAAKALLEHDVVLTLVADRHPDGIGG
ncbi:SRPBCC domain-containing protein [Actinosynnema sp. NPDC053489]|uniref:SRPBCC domain-containing protein n=1 Tax=Actinosynnema sp. NPDC053489 TaxID=3363916 RepID=UPI0037C8F746